MEKQVEDTEEKTTKMKKKVQEGTQFLAKMMNFIHVLRLFHFHVLRTL